MVACTRINRNNLQGDSTDNAINGAVKTKRVYVEKDQYLISMVQLGEISEISWKNKPGLHLLNYLVSSLSGYHNVLGLITIVENEVPMDI